MGEALKDWEAFFGRLGQELEENRASLTDALLMLRSQRAQAAAALTAEVHLLFRDGSQAHLLDQQVMSRAKASGLSIRISLTGFCF